MMKEIESEKKLGPNLSEILISRDLIGIAAPVSVKAKPQMPEALTGLATSDA
jgi:hypothetical protein